MQVLKLGMVLVGALSVTALGIDAADTWRGSSGTLLGQLIGSEAAFVCPEGMVEVVTAQTFRCVDRYEVAAAMDCPVSHPASPRDTETNMSDSKCTPVSEQGREPWRFVAREEAARLCARVGKRLPNAAEWYEVALDTPDQPCMRGGDLRGAGAEAACVSAVGAFDMVGNVWEWVADDVFDGQWQGRSLPETGYVTQADRHGVATVTSSSSPEASYDEAYFWSSASGVFGMIRGGFYGSRADAGVLAVHAATPPTFTGEAIGFRCVR